VCEQYEMRALGTAATVLERFYAISVEPPHQASGGGGDSRRLARERVFGVTGKARATPWPHPQDRGAVMTLRSFRSDFACVALIGAGVLASATRGRSRPPAVAEAVPAAIEPGRLGERLDGAIVALLERNLDRILAVPAPAPS